MAGAATGGARAAGSVAGAYASGAAGKSGRQAAAAGLGNVAKSAAAAAASPLRRVAATLAANYASGKTGGSEDHGTESPRDSAPGWAKALRRRQTIGQAASLTAHTLKGGDSHSGGQGPDISDRS